MSKINMRVTNQRSLVTIIQVILIIVYCGVCQKFLVCVRHVSAKKKEEVERGTDENKLESNEALSHEITTKNDFQIGAHCGLSTILLYAGFNRLAFKIPGRQSESLRSCNGCST